jgi:hypothetical protein
MKRNTRLAILVVIVLAGMGTSAVLAQACPNWSPKFDRITNKEVIAKLKQTNWDEGIAAAGGPEGIIASSKVTLKDAQRRLVLAKEAAEATSSDGQLRSVTWDECKYNNASANSAANCEYLNMSEMILALEGTIELAQCRQ